MKKLDTKNTKTKRSTKEKIIIAICLIIIVIIILLLRGCSKEEPFIPNLSENSTSWNGQQNKKKEVEQGYIEMPYYEDLYVNEDEPYIWLNNPATNDVYFQYRVTDKDGKDIFYEEALVEPGKAIQANFYSLLEKGTYDITINISAIDEKGNGCNGSTQDTKLMVE